MWRARGNLDLPADFRSSVDYWQKNSIGLLTGSSACFALALMWQVHLYCQGKARVFNLDCALRFNAFTLADEALRLNIPSEEMLHNILIQRAFTPYQILDAVERVLTKQSEEPTIYFILAPCKQFFDRDVTHEEGVFLLRRLFSMVSRASSKGIPILIVERNEYNHKDWRRLYQELKGISGLVWDLNSNPGDYRIRHTLHIVQQNKDARLNRKPSGAREEGLRFQTVKRLITEERIHENGPHTPTLFHANRTGRRAV